jgi:hypothetical protein
LTFVFAAAFRCAYCNYFNGSRKQKPVFNADLFASTLVPPNGVPIEHREASITDSSDSMDPTEQSKVTRRSIRVSARKSNGNQSRSISRENKRSSNPANLSSSEESPSSNKTK